MPGGSKSLAGGGSGGDAVRAGWRRSGPVAVPPDAAPAPEASSPATCRTATAVFRPATSAASGSSHPRAFSTCCAGVRWVVAKTNVIRPSSTSISRAWAATVP